MESTNSSTAPPSSLEDSLHHLTETLKSHTDKIFYLQISDGRFVSKEILIHQANEQQIQPLYAYSNAYRPLPFQTRILGSEFGLVPVMKILRAVLATGWRGPWSYEVTSSSYYCKYLTELFIFKRCSLLRTRIGMTLISPLAGPMTL